MHQEQKELRNGVKGLKGLHILEGLNIKKFLNAACIMTDYDVQAFTIKAYSIRTTELGFGVG